MKQTETIQLNRSNIAYLNGGRIPIIESDGLPIQYITVEKAQRVCTSLKELDENVKSIISEIQSYSHSAKYIIQAVKSLSEDTPDVFEKHFNQHQRLMGGTLFSLISISLSSIEGQISDIRKKIGISEEVIKG